MMRLTISIYFFKNVSIRLDKKGENKLCQPTGERKKNDEMKIYEQANFHIFKC